MTNLNEPNFVKLIGEVIVRFNSIDFTMASIIQMKILNIHDKKPIIDFLYDDFSVSKKVKILNKNKELLGLSVENIDALKKLVTIRNNIAHSWLKRERSGEFTIINKDNIEGRGLDFQKQYESFAETYMKVNNVLIEVLEA